MARPWALLLLFVVAARAADLQLDARVLLLSTEASKDWAAPFLTQIMTGARGRQGGAARAGAAAPARAAAGRA
jgi:hypothetical protein